MANPSPPKGLFLDPGMSDDIYNELIAYCPSLAEPDRHQVEIYYALLDDIAPLLSNKLPVVANWIRCTLQMGHVPINDVRLILETEKLLRELRLHNGADVKPPGSGSIET